MITLGNSGITRSEWALSTHTTGEHVAPACLCHRCRKSAWLAHARLRAIVHKDREACGDGRWVKRGPVRRFGWHPLDGWWADAFERISYRWETRR